MNLFNDYYKMVEEIQNVVSAKAAAQSNLQYLTDLPYFVVLTF